MVSAITVAVAAPALARAANPAANLDQCRNGTVSAPAQCSGSAWVNGNLGETNSHYREADFVPFRATLTNLDPAAASHTIVIQYDTLEGSKHAYDYLGSYNATETDADPTSGLSGLGAGNCFAVPLDLRNMFANPGSSQTPGCIQIWNGTITSVSYGLADASDKRSASVSFTASDPTVLLAWGGHVASQIDWGLGNSASAISGSPYHMRVLMLDATQLGNQDRSIKASAILPIPPGFTTQTSPTQISVGQSVTDTATLAGTSSNGAVTGFVTFFVCGPAASNPDCTAGGAQVGSPVAIDGAGHAVSAPFTPSLPGDYCFRAQYAPDSTAAYSPSHHTNLTSECVSVSNPSLEISKAADAASVSAGDPIGFTISVSNPGAGTALGVTVSDPLPAGSGVSWSVDGANSDSGCSIAAGTLACSFGDLAPSASKHVHVTSPTTKDSCKAYPNTATAQAINNAPVIASASTAVACPQIGITKVADAAGVAAGDQIGFTITLSNSGAGIARSVSASDLLPTNAGTNWSIDAANSDSGWSIASGSLGYGPQDLAPGASVHVHVVSPTANASCGTVENSASVSATNDGSAQDEASVVVDCPDVAVTKTAAASSIDAGDTASFTIVVSNAGAGVARNVTLEDPLPAGIDWSTDNADCSISAGTLRCSFGDLAAAESRTVHVSGATMADDCGTLHNTARASAANERDSDLENNAASASIVVNCPQLGLNKTADAASVKAGEQLGFTITVSNSGAGTAKDVRVSDALPANPGLAFTVDAAKSDSGCSIASGTLSCAFGDLAQAQSKAVHLVSPTSVETCGKVDNTASATTANGGSARASSSVAVACPVIDLAITKLDDPDPVFVGGALTYTLGVRNNGPDTATNVVVTDSLPSDTTFVSASAAQGSCSGARIVSCRLGTIAAGASVTITIVVRPTATGRITNTGVVAGTEAESNTSNNTASAQTLVKGRVTPPVCYSLSVRPRSLTVGHRALASVLVRLGAKAVANVRVAFNGAGINRSAWTDGRGMARAMVKPRRRGLIHVRVPKRKACKTQAIGVAGVFKPRFTG